MSVTLVLEPGVTFAAVAGAFADWDGGPTDRHPLLAGEPIGGRWRRDGVTVSYSANPAIRLRVLAVEGHDREQVAAGLAARMPVLDERHARALMDSNDLEMAMLGATAVGLLADVVSVPALEKLSRHREPELAGAARLALQRISATLLTAGSERIADRRRQLPRRDPLLGLVGPPATRRQIIRWLAMDRPGDTEHLAELLVTAMEDEDWEVRWSAVLAAYDHGDPALALAVKRCAPPERVDPIDRQVLQAAREVVGSRLVGAPPRHPRAEHIRACLEGRPTEYDRAFLLLHALRNPVPAAASPPAPPGFTGIPQVVHWLGSDDPDIPSNPIRAALPPRGLAVATRPHQAVTEDEVPVRLAALAAEQGLPLAVPTFTVLEMAIRGPDGRRYPWGNGAESKWRSLPSPWGVEEPIADPQWALLDGDLVALGGLDGRCAGPVHRPALARLRPIVTASSSDSRATLR